MKPADPIDMIVARAARRGCADRDPAAAIIASALGAGTFDPLTVSTAAIIYAFDQEAIEQSWDRLSEHRRQPYYDIAEAALAHVNAQRGAKRAAALAPPTPPA